MKKPLLFWGCIALFSLSFFQACVEADLPPPVSGDPVFSIQGALEGNPFEIYAGLDDRELRPGFSMDGDIKEYHADFIHQTEDAVFPDRLTFIFRSGITGNTGQNIETDLASVLYGFYQKIEIDTTIQHFAFHSTVDNGFPPYQYLWEFGNGLISTQANPVVEFDSDAPFTNVKLQVWDVFGKHASYSSTFLPDAEPLKADFYTAPAVTDVVVNVSVSGGVPEYTHSFNVTNDNNDVFSMPAYSELLDSICMVATDDGNNTVIVCKTLADPSSGSLFSALYDYEKEITPVDNQLSKVTIELMDENGKLFSTALGEQPATSYLEILENQPYENYTDGNKTRRLKVRYNCVLFSEDGVSKTFSGEGYIGIAY